MRIIGIVAVILLGGVGVFYAIISPAISGHLMGVPLGLLLLIAATVVLVYLLRHRGGSRA